MTSRLIIAKTHFGKEYIIWSIMNKVKTETIIHWFIVILISLRYLLPGHFIQSEYLYSTLLSLCNLHRCMKMLDFCPGLLIIKTSFFKSWKIKWFWIFIQTIKLTTNSELWKCALVVTHRSCNFFCTERVTYVQNSHKIWLYKLEGNHT